MSQLKRWCFTSMSWTPSFKGLCSFSWEKKGKHNVEINPKWDRVCLYHKLWVNNMTKTMLTWLMSSQTSLPNHDYTKASALTCRYLDVPTKEVMLNQHIHSFCFQKSWFLKQHEVIILHWMSQLSTNGRFLLPKSPLTSFLSGSSQSWERLKANLDRTLRRQHTTTHMRAEFIH